MGARACVCVFDLERTDRIDIVEKYEKKILYNLKKEEIHPRIEININFTIGVRSFKQYFSWHPSA